MLRKIYRYFQVSSTGEVKYAIKPTHCKLINDVYIYEYELTEASKCIEDVLDDEEMKIFKDVFKKDYKNIVVIKTYIITFSSKQSDIIIKDNDTYFLPTNKVFNYDSKMNDSLKLCKFDNNKNAIELAQSERVDHLLLGYPKGKTIYNKIKAYNTGYMFSPDYLPFEYYPFDSELDFRIISINNG